jgi:hypothetical protein
LSKRLPTALEWRPAKRLRSVSREALKTGLIGREKIILTNRAQKVLRKTT